MTGRLQPYCTYLGMQAAFSLLLLLTIDLNSSYTINHTLTDVAKFTPKYRSSRPIEAAVCTNN